MGRSAPEKRERLFKVFAANLTSHDPSVKDVFVCPLCLDVHSPMSLLGKDPKLSLEHCVPKSLGGTSLTLTCKNCNNSFGKAIDSHLKNKIAAEDAFQGLGGTVDGKFSIEGNAIRCNIGFGRGDGKNISLQTIVKASDSRAIDAAFGIVEQRIKCNETFRGTISFSPGYAENLWKVALVKAAFLLMFRQFGYSYMFLDGPEYSGPQIVDSQGPPYLLWSSPFVAALAPAR